jgi:hypothetical protein
LPPSHLNIVCFEYENALDINLFYWFNLTDFGWWCQPFNSRRIRLYISDSYIYMFSPNIMPITTKVVSSNPVYGEVCSIQHYAIKVCQRLATGRCFFPCTPVTSANKTDRHDITEILLKVVLNTINEIKQMWIMYT